MRVLVIHNLYRWRGGEDDMALRLADLLERRGHAVHRFFADSRDLEHASTPRRVRAAVEAVYSGRAARQLQEVIDRFRPDIAHVFNVLPLLSPSVYDVLARRSLPVFQSIQSFRFLCPSGMAFTRGELCFRCQKGNTLPAVVFRCCHGSLGQSALYALVLGTHRRLRTLGGKTGHLLPVNSLLARMLREEFPSAPITVLPNFIDSERFTMRETFEPSFVFLGRLFPEKGTATLLEALARVNGARLDIVGDGLLAAELKRQADSVAPGRVSFHGYLGGPERFAPLRRALALVLPSASHDACPLVALEAMAQGVPVIASRRGGLPDLVCDGETGRLFEAGLAGELAAIMQAFVDTPEQVHRMGAAARRRAESEFDSASYYQRLHQLYAGRVG